MLYVGDTVEWRGCFNMHEPQLAVVIAIDIECYGHAEAGRSVLAVSWNKITREYVTVSLANGCWAYGNQIKRIEK